MKRFLAIFITAAVLIPLSILPFSADNPSSIRVTITNSVSGSVTVVINGRITQSLVQGQSYTFDSFLDDPCQIVCTTHDIQYRVNNGPWTNLNSILDPTVFYYEDYASLGGIRLYVNSSNDHIDNQGFIVRLIPEPFRDYGINDGVDGAISYTGSVLNFITTNSAILVLVGLSVSMLCILPWGIRKLKQLIKGY